MQFLPKLRTRTLETCEDWIFKACTGRTTFATPKLYTFPTPKTGIKQIEQFNMSPGLCKKAQDAQDAVLRFLKFSVSGLRGFDLSAAIRNHQLDEMRWAFGNRSLDRGRTCSTKRRLWLSECEWWWKMSLRPTAQQITNPLPGLFGCDWSGRPLAVAARRGS